LLNWKLIGKHTCNFMKCCLLRFFSVDILREENMNVTRQILIKMKSWAAKGCQNWWRYDCFTL